MCRSRIYKSKDVELFFNEIHRFDELFHFGLQVRSIFRLDVKISKSSMNRLLRKVYKSLDLTFRFAKFPGYVHSVHFCALRISPERVKTHDILLQIMVAIAVNEHRYFCSFGISCDPPLPLLVLSFLFIFYFALLFFFPLALYTHQSFHPSVCSFCFLSLSLSLSLCLFITGLAFAVWLSTRFNPSFSPFCSFHLHSLWLPFLCQLSLITVSGTPPRVRIDVSIVHGVTGRCETTPDHCATHREKADTGFISRG